MKRIISGLFDENPIFIMFLGMCPALAITTNFENALTMGISLLFVLVISNIIISLIKNLISDEIRIPVYIVIIATLVSVVEMLLNAYTPLISRVLGIYIPLITVNCIVLGRAEAFASKNSVKDSFFDALGMGLGFTFAIVVLATIREILATGSITFVDNLKDLYGFTFTLKLFGENSIYTPAKIFTNPAGAFFTLAFIAAFVKQFFLKKGAKK